MGYRESAALGAMSQGLGLFAVKKADDERREIDRQWELMMEDLRAKREGQREQRAIDRETGREERSIEREGIREAAATERYKAGQAATESYRSATLAQNESQFTRKQVADKEAALQKRLQELDEQYQKQLEANVGEDPGGAMLARHMDRRDQEIVSFVERMATRKAVGYETAMSSPEDFATAVGGFGIHRDAADAYAEQLFPDLQSAPDPNPWTPSQPPHTFDPKTGRATSNQGYMDDITGGPAAAATGAGADGARPIDMIKPPAPGQNQALSPWVHDAGNWLAKPPAQRPQNENPYALMGQRPGG